ncbi:uncharacterized mitochondrial protein AtMg00810-like [Carya illinoinensis]|uniref:uncharacterized mitochondrial protein AtMg00810-like n=1 Tax=Carya illinoinensis TaxID=32201 RepID=UPI001C71ED62|nr:uncharacterized mitochondrial protein AtMg00810-like [Carya illinoinensis]
MQPLPGCEHPLHKVCRLRRAIYGLKQVPQTWFKFQLVVSQQDFFSSPYEFALFLRNTGVVNIILLLNVDGMITTSDDIAGIRYLQNFHSQNFEMKNLGYLNYLLGVEVNSSQDGYYLTQAKYASSLVSKAGLINSKIDNSPLEYNTKLLATDGVSLSDATLNQQLVSSLIYLDVTEPDILYVVYLVSQFKSTSRSTHFANVLRILRYINGTLFHGLHFSSHLSLEIQTYSNAGWAGDPIDRHSTTGYYFLLGTYLISWHSKKQSVVARSSTKTKHHALTNTTC